MVGQIDTQRFLNDIDDAEARGDFNEAADYCGTLIQSLDPMNPLYGEICDRREKFLARISG